MDEFLEREVPGWKEDDVNVSALFKAFSGQREDWQGRLEFWKALIVKIARHLNIIVIDAQEVQNRWFLRQGLLPLCLNDVLHEMLNCGELLVMDERSPWRLGWLLSLVGQALGWTLALHGEGAVTGKLVIGALLKEKAAKISQILADTNWKSDCVVTMKTFVELCGELEDAKALMQYMCRNRLARHVCINNAEERIEGLKISLVQSSVRAVSKVDYHMLQLLWTTEKMKQRFNDLDQRVLQLRRAAIMAVERKDKLAAVRHLRLMKGLSQSRDQCSDLMARITDVVDAIFDAEATKKVSEAIQLANRAMKEQHMILEEVHWQLKELDESISLARQAGDAFGESGNVDDSEVEGEFARLEAEMHREPPELAGHPVTVPSENEKRLQKAFSELEIAA